MRTRIITAIAALALFVPVLWFSDTVIFPAAFGILSGVAAFEFIGCVSNKKQIMFFAPVILAAAVMPLAARYFADYMIYLVSGVFIYLISLSVLSYKNIKSEHLFSSFFGFAYAALPFSALVAARDLDKYDYLLIFIAAWCTDTFAYFSGRFFGKRKLCPDLSPKKTIEGSIGGALGAALGFCIYGLVKINYLDGDFNFPVYIVIAIVASALSQIGDLAASAVKRHYNIKDYGKIFPGHGGVLDRFDSILPLAVIAYLLINLVM